MVRSTIQILVIVGIAECTQGGAIERWEDESFRKCYADILSGNWPAHDPYELEGRLDARSSLYGRPGQVGYLFCPLSYLIFVVSGDYIQVFPRLASHEVCIPQNFGHSRPDMVINPVRLLRRKERSGCSLISSSQTHTLFSARSSAPPSRSTQKISSSQRIGCLVHLLI